MNVIGLISSSNFIVVNKSLAREIGLIESVVLGELASEYDHWKSTGNLDDGYFYSTVDNLSDNTTLSKYQQRAAIDNLKEKGIIEVTVKGLPAKRYIKINEEQVEKLLNNKLSKNSPTGCQVFSPTVGEKLDGNNNKDKNNNNNNSIKKEYKESPQESDFTAAVVDYLNAKAGTHYRAGVAKTHSLIKARANEGFTEADFRTVIDKKCTDWIGTEYEQYLRPQTLFGTKFESYLNGVPYNNRIDSRLITSPQKNTVPREKRLPWVPDEVYNLPDFGYITSDVYPYDGTIEYIDCHNNYASWEAPNKEMARKIDADYKAYAAEKERQRKESEAQ